MYLAHICQSHIIRHVYVFAQTLIYINSKRSPTHTPTTLCTCPLDKTRPRKASRCPYPSVQIKVGPDHFKNCDRQWNASPYAFCFVLWYVGALLSSTKKNAAKLNRTRIKCLRDKKKTKVGEGESQTIKKNGQYLQENDVVLSHLPSSPHHWSSLLGASILFMQVLSQRLCLFLLIMSTQQLGNDSW
jgi:hypothetical protein